MNNLVVDGNVEDRFGYNRNGPVNVSGEVTSERVLTGQVKIKRNMFRTIH